MESYKVVENEINPNSKLFYQFHGVQLIGINFPPDGKLISQLHDKLRGQIFDAGEYFEILENEDTERFELRAKVDLKATDKVFLIDHALTFRYVDLRQALIQNNPVKERIMNMLKYYDKTKEHPLFPKSQKNASFNMVELDNQDIEDPLSIDIPQDVVALSLWGNKINDLQKIRELCTKHKDLKVLWLNENPVDENRAQLLNFIETEYPHIELLNSEFTRNVGEWGFKFATSYPHLHRIDNIILEELKSLDLSKRNIFNIANLDIFKKMKKLRTLDITQHEITNFEQSNKLLSILKAIPKLKHLKCDQQMQDILWDLYDNKKLVDLCPTLQSINNYYLSYGRPKEYDNDLAFISKNIWKLANSYRLASSEQLDESSIWYIMDEVGSSVIHSDKPNCIISPFLYAPNNKLDDSSISYSIMWVTKNVSAGELLSRDFLFGINEKLFRTARLNVWYKIPLKQFMPSLNQHNERLQKATIEGIKYIESFKEISEKSKKSTENEADLPKEIPLRVVTDNSLLINNLTSKNFEIIKDLEKAQIIWLIANLKEDFNLFKGKFINQFPYESCIVMKHNLANTVNTGLGNVPWLQKTFNLDKELDAFVGDFRIRQKQQRSNLWIIKPPNLARSMDMVVTNNLAVVLRLLETGPRLAQKYIHKPLTLKEKKIDLRFIVLLKSIEPLEVFLYKVFWIRTSNNTYSLDPRSYETYETHFTVMNYGRKLEQINYEEFIERFNEENKIKNKNWSDVYVKIKQLVRELFIAVKKTYPQMHLKNARTIYGMDIMIDNHYQPKLLEMTYSPDCDRACKYHPHFFDDLFNCLFLNDDEKTNVDRVI